MSQPQKRTAADIRGEDACAFRSATVEAVNVEARTVELAFSSEFEVERWYGLEVLDHSPGSVVLGRLQDGAPLLVNHATSDQVGVVESVSIDSDRRGRAVVRFGKSARADEIFQDIIDGIRKHVSVGYFVRDAQLTAERDGVEIWTITRWEPFEISIVPVPADTSVGVGRSLENSQEEQRPVAANNPSIAQTDTRNAQTEQFTEGSQVEKILRNAAGDLVRAKVDEAGAIVQVLEVLEKAGAERSLGSDSERKRSASILEMGDKFGAPELARDAVKEGTSVADFQRSLLDHVNTKHQRPLDQQVRDADIGMTDKEVGKFSFIKVVRALSDPTSKGAQEGAKFEFEASRAAASQLGKNTDKFVIPADVLTRALNTSTAGGSAGNTGGYGIATTMLTSSFIDILRNRTTIMRLGRTIGGLVGNIDIPKQVSAAQGYWLGEDDDATETGIELGQISMQPKTVAAFSEITRKMLVQSSLDVEAMTRFDLAAALALTIDTAGYYGTGSEHQPLGILNHTGINAVDTGVTWPTYAQLVDMETQIALDNADVADMAYVASAGFRGYAKQTLKFASAGSATIWEPGNTVNGYRSEITNQINSGDVLMGNFADLIIALWGGLELQVDPYSNSKKGRVRIIVFQDIDFALRRTESFCLGRNT